MTETKTLVVEIRYDKTKTRQLDITEQLQAMQGVERVMVWRIVKPDHSPVGGGERGH